MANLLRLLAGIVAWAGALWAALQLATLHTSWDQVLCGVWGCGPSLWALVSCHLAWLIGLTPLALAGRAVVPPRWRRPIGVTTFVLCVALVLGVVIREAIDWLPHVGPTARAYFVQRCLFVIATWVDVPVVELGLLSLLWWGRAESQRQIATAVADSSAPSDWPSELQLRNGYEHDRS